MKVRQLMPQENDTLLTFEPQHIELSRRQELKPSSCLNYALLSVRIYLVLPRSLPNSLELSKDIRKVINRL